MTEAARESAAARLARGQGGWSSPATMRLVASLVADVDWERSRIAEVGAGSGVFSQLMGERVRSMGLSPVDHVFACDLIPETFAYEDIPCHRTGPDGRLPFPDDEFDVVVSIEAIEHVENQFQFMRELARVAKPGARVIVTTPNVLTINARIRTLLTGFPSLYDPLPLELHDPRRLGGHIHPISPYFLAYAALRAGLTEPRFHTDRTKRSASALAALTWPLTALGRLHHRSRLRWKRPEILDENRELIAAQASWRMLTSRTTVLTTTKPQTGAVE